ncbi:MAG TPA: hypothetical protein VNP37_08735, partial [Actinomycetospora sp.]|nr:hypothetical protein [Actinomycetospora sp.]
MALPDGPGALTGAVVAGRVSGAGARGAATDAAACPSRRGGAGALEDATADAAAGAVGVGPGLVSGGGPDGGPYGAPDRTGGAVPDGAEDDAE